MISEVARQMKKLPLYTSRVMVTTQNDLEEHTIRTLKPEEGLYGAALKERIARIQEHNMTPNGRGISYCRSRQEIEEEMSERHGQNNQPPQEPPEDEPPDEQPISRRKRN